MSRDSNAEQTPPEPVNPAAEDVISSASSRQPHDRLTVILEQILSATEDTSNADPDRCQVELLAVAAKYSALEFCVDPVLVELIQVLTRRMTGFSDNRLLAMERAMAASLADDHVSFGRLQQMWEQLRGLAANGR